MILALQALLLLPLAALTTCAPAPQQVVASVGNSSIQATAAPPGFAIRWSYPQNPSRIDVCDYWHSAFDAILDATIIGTFNGASAGIRKVHSEVVLSIQPSTSSGAGQLQGRHVVWAIQSLSVAEYTRAEYRAIDGTILMSGTEVGKLTLRRNFGGLGGAQNATTNTTDSDVSDDQALGFKTTSNDTTVLGPPIPGPPLRMRTSLSGVQTYLKDLDMYYVFIQFIAENASKDPAAIADEVSDFRMDRNKVGLTFKHEANQRVVTWNKLFLGLKALSKFYDPATGFQYRESSVTYYSQDPGQRPTDYGVMSTWGFYWPPGVNPGRWNTGNLQEVATS